MAIVTSCPRCHADYRLPSAHRGKKQRCKHCNTTFIPDDGGDDGGNPMLKLCLAAGLFFVLVGGVWAYAILSSKPAEAKSREEKAEEDLANPIRADSAPRPVAGASPGSSSSSSPTPTPQAVVVAPNNPSPHDVSSAVVMLRDHVQSKVRSSLKWLSTAPVEDSRREEVSQALASVLANATYRKDAMPAVARWITKQNAEPVIPLVDDKDVAIRRSAMAALATLDDDACVEAVVKQLGKPGREADAAKALKGAPPRIAEKFLVKYLHAPRTGAGRDVEMLLKGYNTPKEMLLDQTVEDLSSTDVNKRKCACEWMAKTPADGDRQDKVAKALEGLLNDQDKGVRPLAMKALEGWATKGSVNALAKALKDDALRDSAIQALLKIKDEEVIPVLVTQLGSREGEQITRVLIGFGPKSERAVWYPLERGDVMIRRKACEILGEIGTNDSVKLLTRFAAVEKSLKNLANQEAAHAAIRKIKERAAGKST
jgi:HEAT repeat protein